MIYIPVFILGAIIGSFLNVCIYRLPRNESVVRPASRCTSCGSPIKFYDNIPILSYIFLGGRCRRCKAALSLRYPLIELFNALLYVLVLGRFGIESPWVTAVYFVFVSVLLVIFFIDLDHQIIPDSITLPGIPLAIVLGSTVLPDPFLPGDEMLGLRGALAGFAAGGGFFYLVAILGKAVFKKDAMGGGDIKMMAMAGGLLGWKGVLLTTFMGSLFGSIIGISLIALKGREWGSRIPFGPYLATGALISLLWGRDILRWYFHA